MPIKEVLKNANNLFTDTKEKSEMLTGQGKYQPNKNIYFEEMHKAFMKFDNNRAFFEEFLDTIFKINLQSGITGFLKRAFSTPIKKTNLLS